MASSASVRVRLLGGAAHGQILWVDEHCSFVNVHVAEGPGGPKTVRYNRNGISALFTAESDKESIPDAGAAGGE